MKSSKFSVRRSRFKVRSVPFHPSSFRLRTSSHRSLGEGGFTLIEIMVVLAIILVLAGIIIGAGKYAATKAARSRAQAEIAALETALERFNADNGYYPTSTEFRTNATGNSSLLYSNLTQTGKQYINFKQNQLLDGHNLITFTVTCTTGVLMTVTNVVIMDPFGRAYDYYCSPCGALDQTNRSTFDLWSYGPDGINDEGTNDDITNWTHN